MARRRMTARLRWICGQAGRLGISIYFAWRYPALLRASESGLRDSGRQVVFRNAGRACGGAGRRTGAVVWNVAAIDYKKGYSFTMAPLAVKNMIIVGVSGGEYGTRGFVEAYDAAVGNGNGVSTPRRVRASRGTKRGKAIRGKLAERRRGSREYSILRRINCSGQREIPRHRTARRNAWATIYIELLASTGRGYGEAELVFPVYETRRA